MQPWLKLLSFLKFGVSSSAEVGRSSLELTVSLTVLCPCVVHLNRSLGMSGSDAHD